MHAHGDLNKFIPWSYEYVYSKWIHESLTNLMDKPVVTFHLLSGFFFIKESAENKRFGRQLMADEDDLVSTANGTLYKSEYLLMYLESVNLTVFPKNSENAILGTRSVAFKYTDEKTDISLTNDTIR